MDRGRPHGPMDITVIATCSAMEGADGHVGDSPDDLSFRGR